MPVTGQTSLSPLSCYNPVMKIDTQPFGKYKYIYKNRLNTKPTKYGAWSFRYCRDSNKTYVVEKNESTL